jgi:hypothetical protein
MLMSRNLSTMESRRTELTGALLDTERAWIIERCERADGELSLDRLSTAMAAELSDGAGERTPAKCRVSLVHVHLPKLSELGLLDYDAEQEVVASTDALGSVDELVHSGQQFIDAIDQLLVQLEEPDANHAADSA